MERTLSRLDPELDDPRLGAGAGADRQRSWQLALKALGQRHRRPSRAARRPRAIHLGAMAGTVDLMQRCYTGIELRSSTLIFNPRLPEEVVRVEIDGTVFAARSSISRSRQEELKVSSRSMDGSPRHHRLSGGRTGKISPGQT